MVLSREGMKAGVGGQLLTLYPKLGTLLLSFLIVYLMFQHLKVTNHFLCVCFYPTENNQEKELIKISTETKVIYVTYYCSSLSLLSQESMCPNTLKSIKTITEWKNERTMSYSMAGFLQKLLFLCLCHFHQRKREVRMRE